MSQEGQMNAQEGKERKKKRKGPHNWYLAELQETQSYNTHINTCFGTVSMYLKCCMIEIINHMQSCQYHYTPHATSAHGTQTNP